MAVADVGPQRVIPFVYPLFSALGPARTHMLYLPGAPRAGAPASTVRVLLGTEWVDFSTAAIVHRWGALPPTFRAACAAAAPLAAQCATRFTSLQRLATASKESLWMVTAWLGAVVERGVPLGAAHQCVMNLLRNLSESERPVAIKLLQQHSHVFAAAMTDPVADLHTIFDLFDRNGSGALHALPPNPDAEQIAADTFQKALSELLRAGDDPEEA